MRSIRDIKVLENIPVLAPMSQAINSVRIQNALPTIRFLKEHGARLVLVSHMSGEDPATGVGTHTLRPMYEALKVFIPDLAFCPVSVGPEARAAIRDLPQGGAVLLENLRRNPGEIGNDPAFARELASLADVFVQDAFDNCHRKHASMITVPTLLPSYAGFTVEAEVNELSKTLHPKHPSLAVIAGAKFSTKEPVLQKLLKLYDHVAVGGALANDFIQAQGYSVGTSLVSSEGQDHITSLLKNKRLIVPNDVIVAGAGEKRTSGRVAALSDINANEAVLDLGPATAALLADYAKKAKTILWNGPLGLFEHGFIDGTATLARAIAGSKAHSVLGGGDTVVAIEELNLSDRFSFISTGGGAMLDFLADGTLPGLEALR